MAATFNITDVMAGRVSNGTPAVSLQAQSAWEGADGGWKRVFTDAAAVTGTGLFYRNLQVTFLPAPSADQASVYSGYDSDFCHLRLNYSGAERFVWNFEKTSGRVLVNLTDSAGVTKPMTLDQVNLVLRLIEVRIAKLRAAGVDRYLLSYSVEFSSSEVFATPQVARNAAGLEMLVSVTGAESDRAKPASSDKPLAQTEGMIGVYIGAGALLVGLAAAMAVRNR